MQIPWQQLENADIHAFVSLLTTALPTPIELAPAHYQWLASRLTAEQLSLFVPSYAFRLRTTILAADRSFITAITAGGHRRATARLAGCHLSIARQLQYRYYAHGGSRQRWFERWQAIQQATQQTSNHNYTDLKNCHCQQTMAASLAASGRVNPVSDLILKFIFLLIFPIGSRSRFAHL